ncbi:MAG: DUF3455 domain-containing protein [Thermomicrobiales bacterium]
MIRAATSLVLIVALALIVGLAGSATAKGKSARAKGVPPELRPPASAVLLFELGARGVQIYACEADPDDATTFVWTFKGPEAELLNARGEVVGSHFGGPTWQANDGSAVVAAVVARADAPKNKKAIPWLLLEATSHAGSGAFSTVTHIQRLDTVGGVAPKKGCDAAHAGEVARVPYKATYAFYYPAEPAA